MPPPDQSDRFFVACVLLVAAVLLFTRLDDRYLWQDEAETALLAQSVLREGVPTAFDGRNLISQEGGQEFAPPDYVWSWTPWLQHYVAAGSFALLGPDTFSARLPFVLFGLATLLLCHRLALAVSCDRRTARIALLLLLASVPFLLHMRQCRYYAPLCFFSVLVVLQYVRMQQGRPRAHWILALGAVGLFHSHYVVFVGVALGLGLHFLACDRDRRRAIRLATAGSLTLLVTAPFALRFAANVGSQAMPGFDSTLRTLHDGAFHLNQYVFPFALLLVLAALAALGEGNGDDSGRRGGNARAQWGRAAPLVFVTASCVITLAASMPWFFFRYYVPLIPLCAILQALVVTQAWRWRAAAGIALAGVLIVSDLMPRALPIQQHIPRGSVRHLRTGDESPARVVGPLATFVPMAAYLYEIGHEMTGPIEETVSHLRAHAGPDDSIVATYGDLPIQFYTDLRVVGGLTGEDAAPWIDADWHLIRSHSHRAGDRWLKQLLAREVDFAHYEATVLDVLDRPYENRPDPTYHKFRMPSDGLPELRLWRRRTSHASDTDQ
jgi:hypothetical protein